MHAVVGHGALVSVYTVVSVLLVAWRTLAGVGASGVVACLLRATSVSTCRTLIYVSAEVLLICSVSRCTTDGPAGLSAPLVA